MTFHLTRYLQNRTYTHGHLTIEGFPDTFDTLELAIPRDKFSYIKHCLPPGTYQLDTQVSLLSLQSGTIRKPWMTLKKIKWFPKAGLFTDFSDYSLLSGRIFIGLGTDDEWSVNQSDIVTARIVNALQSIYDPSTDTFTEPVTLTITESPDIIIHDYDRHYYDTLLLAQQEQQAALAAEQHLQQLINQSNPPSQSNPSQS